MAFGIAETIATIHASMQAIELYLNHRGTREQVIQTLNLEYVPSRYESIERQVLSIGDAYADLFKAAGDKIADCVKDFADAIRDDQLPREREKLGKSAQACVCKQIKLIMDFMGGRIPDDLEEFWSKHDCDTYFAGKSTP